MSPAVPLLAAALFAFGAAGALADDRHNDQPQRESRGHHAAAPGRSDEPARRAQQQNGGGRVLSVQPSEGGHRVKLLKDGEVRVYNVPEREREQQR